jgi:hypothetical protein
LFDRFMKFEDPHKGHLSLTVKCPLTLDTPYLLRKCIYVNALLKQTSPTSIVNLFDYLRLPVK